MLFRSATVEEQEQEKAPEPTAAGAGDKRAPSTQRAPSAGGDGGLHTSPQATSGATVSSRQGASGTPTGVEVSSPRDDAVALALREPRRNTTRRGSVFSQARQTLDKLEAQYAEEELARAEERVSLDEAWALLRERVESCRRQDAVARAAHEIGRAHV